MSNEQRDDPTFNVTMLSVLREDFEQWLHGRGLELVQVPDTSGWIVIPAAFRFGAPE